MCLSIHKWKYLVPLNFTNFIHTNWLSPSYWLSPTREPMTTARAKSMMFLMILRTHWNLKDLDTNNREAINVLASESEVKQKKSKGFFLSCLLYIGCDQKVWSDLR